MEFLKFNDFVDRKNSESADINEEVEYRFDADDTYTENNRGEVDELLYEYVCNYKDDEVYEDELTLEGLWSYINEDEELSESLRNSLGKYIDACEDSIEEKFDELIG